MKIAYTYNIEGWAIHNVGKKWFGDHPEVDLLCEETLSYEKLAQYDVVIFGMVDSYTKWKIPNSIVVCHDPCELFEQREDWKQQEPYPQRLATLQGARLVITASNEMLAIMRKYKINARLINTESILPVRESMEVWKTQPVRVCTVYQRYPRKRMQWIEEVHRMCNYAGIPFDEKIGRNKIWPEEKYIDWLDSHTIYICTSYMEGGPLTAMDALNRGQVVISTEVGQLQDMPHIFLCKSPHHTYKTILSLQDPTEMQRARLLSHSERTKQTRSKIIQGQVALLIDEIWKGF